MGDILHRRLVLATGSCSRYLLTAQPFCIHAVNI